MKKRARAFALGRRVPTRPQGHIEHLGTDYGGYGVPVDALGPDSVCFCIGVGEDVSFDLALIARFGCQVEAFDPVPRSAEFAKSVAEPNWHFHPYAVWSEDKMLTFHAPEDPEHVSHSTTNLKGTEPAFEAQGRALESLMGEFGNDRLDLLKVSAEGAEYEIVDNALSAGVPFDVLCVEYAQPAPLGPILDSCRRLNEAGYEPAYRQAFKLTFTRPTGPPRPTAPA